jgi:hypothetical protein
MALNDFRKNEPQWMTEMREDRRRGVWTDEQMVDYLVPPGMPTKEKARWRLKSEGRLKAFERRLKTVKGWNQHRYTKSYGWWMPRNSTEAFYIALESFPPIRTVADL